MSIYNGKRKVQRVAEEVKELAKHGVMIKPELQGLHATQVKELKLVDEFEEQCIPSGGFAFEADPVQRRNGRAPVKDLKKVLNETADDVKKKVHRDNVKNGVEVTEKDQDSHNENVYIKNVTECIGIECLLLKEGTFSSRYNKTTTVQAVGNLVQYMTFTLDDIEEIMNDNSGQKLPGARLL